MTYCNGGERGYEANFAQVTEVGAGLLGNVRPCTKLGLFEYMTNK